MQHSDDLLDTFMSRILEISKFLNYNCLHFKEEETSTVSVPVIHLPAWEDEQEDGLEKVAAGALLDMFPQDLLEHSNKVRPVNVKIIEHDGYIDYEIEFVELEDYYDYLDEADL